MLAIAGSMRNDHDDPTDRRRWHTAVRLILLATLLLVALFAGHGTFTGTDFDKWHTDWSTLEACLPEGGCGALTKFPVAYLLNAGIVTAVSSWTSPPVVLWLLNVAALLLPILLAFALRLSSALDRAIIYALGLVFSPIPAFYLWSGALEFQSGILTGLWVVLAARRLDADSAEGRRGEGWVLAGVSFLMPLYKDTVVVLLMIGSGAAILAVAIASRSLAQLPRQLWVGLMRLRFTLIVPLATAVLVEVAYNVLRYGSPLPLAYMSESDLTSPPFAVSRWFLIGSVFSPNGGIVVFWALGFAAVIGCLRVLGARLHGPAVTVAVGYAAVSLLAFAQWWAPFGWTSWGNRLMVPPMVCLLVVTVFSARQASGGAVARSSPARSPWRIAMAGVVLAAAGLSANYVAASYFMENALHRSLMETGPACTRLESVLAKDIDMRLWRTKRYYACVRERFLYVPAAWR